MPLLVMNAIIPPGRTLSMVRVKEIIVDQGSYTLSYRLSTILKSQNGILANGGIKSCPADLFFKTHEQR